jgi:hypothetical protein
MDFDITWKILVGTCVDREKDEMVVCYLARDSV